MKVKIASNAGFCGGVQRAYLILEKETQKSATNKKYYILGSLVHNENVMKRVGEWGVKKIKSLRGIARENVVVITAHGASKKIIEKIKKRGAMVFDATCPKVSLIHGQVEKFSHDGWKILIYGDRNHKEVRGISGWCGKKTEIISNLGEARKIAKTLASEIRRKRKILLVSQTTQNQKLFEKIGKLLEMSAKKAGLEFRKIDTICDATAKRQNEARLLSGEVDLVVVVGGKKSANTRRLWEIAKKNNRDTVWIEQLDDHAKQKLKELSGKLKSAAILSGASTPIWDIERVAEYLNKL